MRLFQQSAAVVESWQEGWDLRALASRFSRLARRLKHAWIQEVPDELAACEFGCLATDCRLGEWETCAQRRRFKRSFDQHTPF